MVWIWLICGLVLLVIGADVMVRGAVAIASALKISPLVIGLTVVAFGTSTPELAVSAASGLGGEPEIALGNVLGSNIFNVLFILGLSALIVPLSVSAQLVRLDVPLMIGVSLLTWYFAGDGSIDRVEGGVLFAGVIVYTIAMILIGRRAGRVDDVDPEVAALMRSTRDSTIRSVVLIIAGLTMLMIGANWLVDSSTSIARGWGVSELIIGVTIVAIGTSLPEVAASLAAAFRGQRDLAVGNVVGSNLFNLMGVLGVASLVSPAGMPVPDEALRLDIPMMVFVACVTWPVVFTRTRVSRWEGGLLFVIYLVYTGYLVLSIQQHPQLDRILAWLWMPVAPVVAAAFVGMSWWDHRSSRKRDE